MRTLMGPSIYLPHSHGSHRYGKLSFLFIISDFDRFDYSNGEIVHSELLEKQAEVFKRKRNYAQLPVSP